MKTKSSDNGKNRYDLMELPAGVELLSDANCDNTNVLKWSGQYPIPQIGDCVRIKFNQFGTGVVESYFTEYGYLGVCVRLDKEPDWKVRQHAGTKWAGIALVFGIEITLEVASKS